MRRLFFCIVLLLVTSVASAQPREALLTPDGTLFTLETVITDDAPDIAANVHLVLHARQGDETHEEIIPATAEKGRHSNPAMAYDAASRTLFVFWLRHQGLLYNELVVASRAPDGTWSPATTFAFGQQFNSRENLRIAVTRRVSNEDGTLAPTPALSVHIVWWELDSTTGIEAAHYAMLPIEDGRVASVDQLALTEFAIQSADAADESTGESSEEIDLAILRQPMLFSSPTQDSVLLLFGDYGTKRLHEVRIRPTLPPTSDGRLRVPVGRTERGHGAPRFDVATNSRIEGIYNSDRLAFFTRDDGKLRYVLLKNGVWTEPRTISLDTQITGDAAVEALRRLVTEN